jgi:hypothetical protein
VPLPKRGSRASSASQQPTFCSPRLKFFGDGSDGPLVVDDQDTIKVNHYVSVKGTARETTKMLFVRSTDSIRVGSEICIVQMRGHNVGQAMFARVITVNAFMNTLSIDIPMRFECSSEGLNRCQVVTVPHYTNVTLKRAAQIVGAPWHGHQGGVIMFRASEYVRRYNSRNQCPYRFN